MPENYHLPRVCPECEVEPTWDTFSMRLTPRESLLSAQCSECGYSLPTQRVVACEGPESL